MNLNKKDKMKIKHLIQLLYSVMCLIVFEADAEN